MSEELECELKIDEAKPVCIQIGPFHDSKTYFQPIVIMHSKTTILVHIRSLLYAI